MTLVLEQTHWAQTNMDVEATYGNINGYFAKQTTKFKLTVLIHVWIADRGVNPHLSFHKY